MLQYNQNTRILDCCVEFSQARSQCTVQCDRGTFVQVMTGVVEASAALMCGMIVVDDMNKLLEFKAAFNFKRDVYEAWRSRRVQRKAVVHAVEEATRAAFEADSEMQEAFAFVPDA